VEPSLHEHTFRRPVPLSPQSLAFHGWAM
jgi:hypothetical protein